MQRRQFLKSIAAASTLTPFLHAQSRNKRRGSNKKMVIIFLRGGNDGINTMIPIDATQFGFYQSLRPNLHLPLAQILDIGDSFFGLHPSLAPLVPIHAAGHLSFIHCCGYPNPDRSHFESESFWETAIPGNTLAQGWLNRYLQNTTGAGLIRGLSIGWNIQQSVLGSVPVPISSNFGSISIGDDTGTGGAITQQLETLYNAPPTPGNSDIYATGDKIYDMINAFQTRNVACYDPATADPVACAGTTVHLENGAVYPNHSIGSQLSHAAQMLKDTPEYLGVEFVVTDMGGYDSHAQQGTNTGDHPDLLSNLAQAMAAFYTDMGSVRMNDVTVMVISEFGRRAYENDSLGTDHGTGGLAMVMNNNITGGVINGGANWPGLDINSGELYEGHDLDWVTDFRDIYWEVLSNHMSIDNASLASIIPGHTYSPVGFL